MSFLDLLFPKRCVSCGKLGSYLCPECFARIKRAPFPICPLCQRRSFGGKTHYSCQKPWGLDGLTSLFSYSGPIKVALRKIKFHFLFDLLPSLAKLAEEEIEENEILYHFLLEKPTVVPIPLYWLRENRRGFNQSALLGKYLSQRWGLDFREVLLRQRYTLPQSQLGKKEREQNIRGVFKVRENCPVSSLSPILLVDDVWTTGATMREAAKVLKRRGVKRVWGLTLAKGGG